MPERAISAGEVTLAASDEGEGLPVVLAHGLTASRRYVVMGSRALQRAGHRVIAFDARGHGASSPAPEPVAYGYDRLSADLLAVLDAFELDRAVIAGASMGAHTALRVALELPERVAGLALITPGYDPVGHDDERRLARWDALADGLRRSGIEGFVDAYAVERIPPAWRDTVVTVMRQRLQQHAHLDAVADALNAVPRSRPFADLHALEQIECPALVVASRDEADPGHSHALGEAYAELLPRGRLAVEDEGRSPLAWQGGQLSKLIAGLAHEAWRS